jgi:hypothetical protein
LNVLVRWLGPLVGVTALACGKIAGDDAGVHDATTPADASTITSAGVFCDPEAGLVEAGQTATQCEAGFLCARGGAAFGVYYRCCPQSLCCDPQPKPGECRCGLAHTSPCP